MAEKIWVGGTTSHLTHYDDAANWSPAGVPETGDSVVIPASAAYAITGFDASAVLLIGFTIQKGYAYSIGSAATPLKIDSDAISIAGTAQQFLDLNNPTSDVLVTEAAADSGNRHGCNIKGVGIARLTAVLGQNQTLGLASGAGETLTCSAVAVNGGTVEIGSGVTKVGGGAPDVTVQSGTVDCRCAVGTVVNYGTFTHHAGASASISNYGGSLTVNSTGTPTLIVLAGGTLNMGPSAGAPTAFNVYGTGWVVNDPFGRITAAWNFYNSSPWSGTATVQANRKWTPAAI